MNLGRIALAAVGGTVACVVAGMAMLVLVPQVMDEGPAGGLRTRRRGVFVAIAFALHNYVNLSVGLTLMLMQAAAYFVEWTAVGTVIGLLYRPPV